MPELTVAVVDDDQAVRISLQMLVETLGVRVLSFPNAAAFMQERALHRRLGCLILDVRMPGTSGLQLQEQLEGELAEVPVIFLSGHGDVPMVVRAMRAGAIDFLSKPFNEQLLLDRVQEALQLRRQRMAQRRERSIGEARLALLTPRESEVLAAVADGLQNKEIAERLGISVKTIEQHRSRIMEKLRCRTAAELVRVYLTAGGAPDRGNP